MTAAARYCILPTVALLLVCLGLVRTTAAQEETPDGRLERVAGIAPDAAKAFYEALRGTVGRSEPAAACGLLAYPLQHASGVVADAAACVANYDTLFTIPVRRAIGRQRYEELFINDISVAAPVLGSGGEPIAAVNIAVSKLRCGVSDAESRYAPLVTGAASAMSHALPMDRSA